MPGCIAPVKAGALVHAGAAKAPLGDVYTLPGGRNALPLNLRRTLAIVPVPVFAMRLKRAPQPLHEAAALGTAKDPLATLRGQVRRRQIYAEQRGSVPYKFAHATGPDRTDGISPALLTERRQA